jgi:hypothetical protein
LGVSLPVRAVEFKFDKEALHYPGEERTPQSTMHAGVELSTWDQAVNNTAAKDQLDDKRSEDRTSIWEVAQFQLPKHKEQMFRLEGFGEPPSPLITHLKYDYSYGSESEITYRKNPDLTNRLKDDALILTPEINAYITYRPTNWLETTLEMIIDREIGVVEEDFVVLPDGEIEFPEKREWSLLVDQAFFTIKNVIDPFKITVGRKNYEDSRINRIELTPSCCIPTIADLRTSKWVPIWCTAMTARARKVDPYFWVCVPMACRIII